MAEVTDEITENHRLVDTITDPQLSWVGPEPRGIASTITLTAGGMYTLVEEGNAENWEVYCPAEGKRVFSSYSDDRFAMYEFVGVFGVGNN
ncbi:hypothetical protein A2U01_0064023, partial [Trifolium medium]|nr:hypothetical protein [Trifolium medium]